MCGITGFVSLNSSDETIISKMTNSLNSRGPDHQSFWTDNSGSISLGHTRLSILELSRYGNQPMISLNKRFVISFNGEIYNHFDIRKNLNQKANFKWKGNSDTETILESFSLIGIEETLKMMNGMFAFVLLDRQEKKIFLARDRLGEKPLYYGRLKKTFFFGSELKSFVHHPDWSPSINSEALNLYLRYSYVPTPFCIYDGIYKLEPGTIITFDINKFEISDHKSYWDLFSTLDKSISCRHNFSNDEVINELDLRIKNSVKMRMLSDVPIGVSLSGGIDSSLIAAEMQSLSKSPINTFTIGFDTPGYNEANSAKAISSYLGTSHNELYIKEKDAISVIPNLPIIWDEPFADSSQIPTFILSKLIKSHVSVSLAGDGGDELFCGYNRYNLGYKIFKTFQKYPKNLKYLFSNLLKILPSNYLDRYLGKLFSLGNIPAFGDRIQKLSNTLTIKDDIDYYKKLVSVIQSPSLFLRNEIKDFNLDLLEKKWRQEYDFREIMMALDMKTYLPDDILVKTDRASMSNGLETRVPYLDHTLIEWTMSLPFNQKIYNGKGKWALYEVLCKYVPEELINRPKMGFGIPIDQWLCTDLRDWTEEMLSERELKNSFFEPNQVRKIWEEHKSQKYCWHHQLWTILNFQAWYKHWH